MLFVSKDADKKWLVVLILSRFYWKNYIFVFVEDKTTQLQQRIKKKNRS